MSSNKKIKAADIAAATGVSPATVSRVINRSGYVKKSTYKKVAEAMETMGYETSFKIPSDLNEILIFSIPAISNYFYGGILNGVETAAKQHGYQVLIYEGEINENTAQQFFHILKKTHAVGVVTCNQIKSRILEEINRIAPVVQCCEYNNEIDLPFVTINDVQASKNAVEYLASLGRKRIAMINGPEYYKYSRHRLKGYKEGLASFGLEFVPSLVTSLPEVSIPLAISTALQMIDTPNPPDAFFTASDTFGVAVIRAAHKLGYKVPEDIAVIGFDNIDISSATTPPLTTVNQPRTQLGFSACELLIKVLNGQAHMVKKVTLETELIIRESTK